MELDLTSLDAKLKEKEEEIRNNVSDEEYHDEIDIATINVCGEALSKWYDSQKRKQYGEDPINMRDVAREMAAHIKGKYMMESTEEQIIEQIINNSKTYLVDGYYDN